PFLSFLHLHFLLPEALTHFFPGSVASIAIAATPTAPSAPRIARVFPEIAWLPAAAGAAPPCFFLLCSVSWPARVVEVCCASLTATFPCCAATTTESSFSATSNFDGF